MVSGTGKSPSPLVGLLLMGDMPGRLSPPMNSLPPLLWCPCRGLDGVVGAVVNVAVDGESGGDVSMLGFNGPAGLKVKLGRALTDFCLM